MDFLLKALSASVYGNLKDSGASRNLQIQRKSQTVTRVRDKGELGRRGAAAPGTLLRLTSWLFQGCDGTFSDL